MVVPRPGLSAAARGQRGVALIMAMVIVAVISVLMAQIAQRQLLDIRRTSNILAYDQGHAYATGMEAWAAAILRRDRQSSADVDALGEVWAQPTPPLPVEGGQLAGRLEDLQGRFNLNNLYSPGQTGNAQGSVNANQLEYFRRLLQRLGINPAIAEAVVDWIDLDEQAQPLGAEDSAYLRVEPNYRTGNWRMSSITELRLVDGVDAEIYAALAPHVATLPAGTRININTATAPVIAALHPELGLSNAEALIEERGLEGFTELGAVQQSAALGGGEIQLPVDLLDLKSEYFLGRVDVELGDARLVHYSILHAPANGVVSVIARANGVW